MPHNFLAILLALSVNILTSLPTWPSPSGLDSAADTMTGNAEAATVALGVASDAEAGSVHPAPLYALLPHGGASCLWPGANPVGLGHPRGDT